ncbi:hypothetical protein ACP70R_042048 [Stipagrostis hirtigluma subsp. patula]
MDFFLDTHKHRVFVSLRRRLQSRARFSSSAAAPPPRPSHRGQGVPVRSYNAPEMSAGDGEDGLEPRHVGLATFFFVLVGIVVCILPGFYRRSTSARVVIFGAFLRLARRVRQAIFVLCILSGLRRPPAPTQPIGAVKQHNSWEAYLGRPMEQTVPGTCALVACTVCVEAMHRYEYETYHGGGGAMGTFPWTAAEPDELLGACRDDGIWTASEGAYVGDVLTKIQELGGVRTTSAPKSDVAAGVLPLRSWQEHRWDDDGHGLSPERVARLLDCRGPCVGTVTSTPAATTSRRLYGGEVGLHAVVCFAYRVCGDQMHVLVLDNHTSTGPRRWVDVEELDALYTMDVERLRTPSSASGG